MWNEFGGGQRRCVDSEGQDWCFFASLCAPSGLKSDNEYAVVVRKREVATQPCLLAPCDSLHKRPRDECLLASPNRSTAAQKRVRRLSGLHFHYYIFSLLLVNFGVPFLGTSSGSLALDRTSHGKNLALGRQTSWLTITNPTLMHRLDVAIPSVSTKAPASLLRHPLKCLTRPENTLEQR